jgi:hypothetical protein
VQLARHRGRDWRAELARWFEGAGCDALVLSDKSADALDYATLWLLQEQASEAGVAEHLEEQLTFYAREEIEGVGAGMLVLRRVEGRTPWVEIRETPAHSGPGGESLAGLFEARDRLLGVPEPEGLLDLRLSPAPDLELLERRSPAGGRWAAPAGELRLARGYAFAARVDPVAAAIAGRSTARARCARPPLRSPTAPASRSSRSSPGSPGWRDSSWRSGWFADSVSRALPARRERASGSGPRTAPCQAGLGQPRQSLLPADRQP